jgi:ferredoxin-NADP reductase
MDRGERPGRPCGAQPARLPPAAEPQVFVCGPTGFVDAVADAMIDLGHPSEKIKTERFGASGGT